MNISYKIAILFGMIFCHIVDDYYLQSWLASAKQKSWWKQNSPGKLYRYDYIAALFMHSFSWSFMIMLIPTVILIITGSKYNPIVLIANLFIHMFVDDLKANKKKINLIQDQLFHIVQIILTWSFLIGRL